MAIDPNIKEKTKYIRDEPSAIKVRDSIADGLDLMSEDVEAIKERQITVEETMQTVIDETTEKDVISAPEIIAAHVDSNGTAHPNLKSRLDNFEVSATQQLAHKLDADTLNDYQETVSNIWSAQKTKEMISIIPKGEPGPKGDPGSASLAINDAETTVSSAWSGKKTNDETLPYFKNLYSSLYPSQGSNLYFENVGTSILINFATLNIRNAVNGSVLFATCKAVFPEKIVTSPKGVECLSIITGECFGYDTVTNLPVIISFAAIPKTVLPILVNANGEVVMGFLQYNYLKNISKTVDTRVTELKTEVDNLSAGVPVVPAYWREHLNGKIALIKGHQSAAGHDGTSFGFITDIHYGSNAKNSGILLEKVMTECNIPYYYNGGDVVTGAGIVSKEVILKDLNDCNKMLSHIKDREMFALGNHDANYGIHGNYDSQLSDGEIFNYIFREKVRHFNHGNGKKGDYYFVDDEFYKIRYITLNAVDVPTINNPDGTVKAENNTMFNYVYRQEQLSWLATKALQTPNDEWSVVVCSHLSPTRGVVNGHIMMGILDAYKKKTSYTGASIAGTRDDLLATVTTDFTNAGGDIICVVSGHVHEDVLSKSFNSDIQLVETLNDSLPVVAGQPVKTVGTTTEQAFDIFTINKATRTVHITRIGAGSDRLFSY